MILLALLGTASCSGGGGGGPIDGGPVDAPPLTCDAQPILPVCGCPDRSDSCLSIEVTDWVDGRALGPGDGVTVYLLDDPGTFDLSTPIATAIPDADGRVVIDAPAVPPGQDLFVVVDDDPGAVVDAWATTSTGPFELPGVIECIRAPGVTRARGDVYLGDLGFSPSDNVGGMVILELSNLCGAPSAGVGVDTSPEGAQGYFTGDRLRANASGTTSAGAVLTVAATYCSPLCLNLDCSCGDPECGPHVDFGGATNGFMFAAMRCDTPD